MSDSLDKNFDDLVYDDEFYKESMDSEPFIKEERDQKRVESNDEGRVVFLVCDECDNRWEDYISDEDDADGEDRVELYCPMCGSSSVTIL